MNAVVEVSTTERIPRRGTRGRREGPLRSLISPFKSHTSTASGKSCGGTHQSGLGVAPGRSRPFEHTVDLEPLGNRIRVPLDPHSESVHHPIDATLSHSVPARIRPSLRVSNA